MSSLRRRSRRWWRSGRLYVRVQVGVAVDWRVWDGDWGQFDRRHLALRGLTVRSDVTVAGLLHRVSARLGVGRVSSGAAQSAGLSHKRLSFVLGKL